MKTTLAERVKIAMNGPPKVPGKALAAACGIAAPSVSDWRSGKTQTIEGANLIRASEFLGVRAKWLAEGVGPMREDDELNHKVMTPVATYRIQHTQDPMTVELLDLFGKLDKAGKAECLGYVRGFVMGRRPHAHGPASAVAG